MNRISDPDDRHRSLEELQDELLELIENLPKRNPAESEQWLSEIKARAADLDTAEEEESLCDGARQPSAFGQWRPPEQALFGVDAKRMSGQLRLHEIELLHQHVFQFAARLRAEADAYAVAVKHAADEYAKVAHAEADKYRDMSLADAAQRQADARKAAENIVAAAQEEADEIIAAAHRAPRAIGARCAATSNGLVIVAGGYTTSNVRYVSTEVEASPRWLQADRERGVDAITAIGRLWVAQSKGLQQLAPAFSARADSFAHLWDDIGSWRSFHGEFVEFAELVARARLLREGQAPVGAGAVTHLVDACLAITPSQPAVMRTAKPVAYVIDRNLHDAGLADRLDLQSGPSFEELRCLLCEGSAEFAVVLLLGHSAGQPACAKEFEDLLMGSIFSGWTLLRNLGSAQLATRSLSGTFFYIANERRDAGTGPRQVSERSWEKPNASFLLVRDGQPTRQVGHSDRVSWASE